LLKIQGLVVCREGWGELSRILTTDYTDTNRIKAEVEVFHPGFICVIRGKKFRRQTEGGRLLIYHSTNGEDEREASALLTNDIFLGIAFLL